MLIYKYVIFFIPQDDIFPGQINLLKNKKQYE